MMEINFITTSNDNNENIVKNKSIRFPNLVIWKKFKTYILSF